MSRFGQQPGIGRACRSIEVLDKVLTEDIKQKIIIELKHSKEYNGQLEIAFDKDIPEVNHTMSSFLFNKDWRSELGM